MSKRPQIATEITPGTSVEQYESLVHLLGSVTGKPTGNGKTHVWTFDVPSPPSFTWSVHRAPSWRTPRSYYPSTLAHTTRRR